MWQMWGIILLQIRMDINLWLRDGKEQKNKNQSKLINIGKLEELFVEIWD